MSKLVLFLILSGILFWWASRRFRRVPPPPPPSSTATTLSEREAREVLGLGLAPSREDIIEAHRRLMQKVHPDVGGSTYLARQLNEAKKVLLEHNPKRN
jgi:hypothetical protein